MSKFGFDKVIKNIEQTKKALPKVIANDTKNFFLDSWAKQGWDGKDWQVPQRKVPGTSSYKYPKKGAEARHTRATLVKTGALRRAVANSLKVCTFELIKFQVDSPYAAVHNFGLPIRGGTMPQRQFMGDSPKLRQQQLTKINEYFNKIWQA
jgi:phage gpG-like protein